MSLKLFVYIALGGAAGAVGRYVSTVAIEQWIHSGFPYATLFVNTLGSFLLGCLLAALALGWGPSAEFRTFIQVGILGAFTTFSAFSVDAYGQISRGEYLEATLYIGGSVVLGIVALVSGVALTRQVMA